MKTTFKHTIIIALALVCAVSCGNYLDIVPDNVATIDNAFTTRAQAKKYLFTCYSYLPNFQSPEYNPALFGGGNTPSEALDELRETLRLVKKDGREIAFIYPEWLDGPFEFQTRWNVKDLMAYYAGIITPAALGRLSGINPKQIWSYMHGVSTPRKAQLQKMETALQQLGRELMHISFC